MCFLKKESRLPLRGRSFLFALAFSGFVFGVQDLENQFETCKGLDKKTCSVLVRKIPRFVSPSALLKWRGIFKDACSQGDTVACSYAYVWGASSGLNQMQLRGLQSACEVGDPSACLAVGLVYRASVEVPLPSNPSGKSKENLKNAIKFYEKACELGEAMACYNLAAMNEAGVGLEKSYTRAGRLFQKACELGMAKACSEAGGYFSEGKIGETSFAKAHELFEKGCKLDHGAACIGLGDSYWQGQNGFEKSIERARELFVEACYFSEDPISKSNGCNRLKLEIFGGEGLEK